MIIGKLAPLFKVLILLLAAGMNHVTGFTALVTGANGYIGRAVVHELIQSEAFNDIVCLVRSPRVTSEQAFWSGSSKVRVLPYDMLDGGESLRHSLQTCREGDDRCLFHVASVFGPTEDHKQTALDNVKGTEDVVRVLSEQKEKCKLILTSSMAAVRGTGQEPSNGNYYTHHDWNNLSELGKNWGSSYQWSKMESERRAKELCDEHDIPLVVLNPSFVFGPTNENCMSSSYSLDLVGQWARGESPVQSRLFVDVRDVAKAHIEAAVRPDSAGKRFIVSTEARIPSREIAGWLKEVAIQTSLSNSEKIHFDGDFDGGAIPIGSKEVDAARRLYEELGVELRPVKQTITEMALALLQVKTKV
jgi:nucleoside-diphosphate-sugar epimerase